MGNGRIISFWKDKWVGDLPFMQKFPRLYSLSLAIEKVVCEVGNWVSLDSKAFTRWNLNWRRGLFVWEQELEGQLLALLSTIKWSREMLDKWIWEDGDIENYTAGSRYMALKEFDQSQIGLWFKQIWKIPADGPAKVCVWRVLIGKLPTRDNLIRRQITLPSPLCLLCNIEEEKVQHVFFNCSVAQKVWDKYDKWIGIESVRHHTTLIILPKMRMIKHSDERIIAKEELKSLN